MLNGLRLYAVNPDSLLAGQVSSTNSTNKNGEYRIQVTERNENHALKAALSQS